jgi:glycosyltransferase involved in cell wall biosynthesis
LKYLPDRRLVIVGGNKEEDISRIKKLAHEIGVDARIEFIGYVYPKEVEKYFNRAGVGVIPITNTIGQRLFTSPMKLFEYMAAKVPIVASNLPAIREILENGKTAVLVEPDNPKALAEGIEKVLTDREFARKIVEQAYKKVQDFTWEKRAENITIFLENILRTSEKSNEAKNFRNGSNL